MERNSSVALDNTICNDINTDGFYNKYKDDDERIILYTLTTSF